MNKNKKKVIFIFLFMISALLICKPVLAARIDYSSMCSSATEANIGIRNAMRILGYAIQFARWIVPGLLIVFGMIDFVKAVVASDDKAINKAVGMFIKRFIAAVVIFFIPTIMMALLDFFAITKGIEKADDPNFGACTKCVFDPFNSCS